jgi:glutathione synthase/RimK-type ligase-like ATP-grasp enzyme
MLLFVVLNPQGGYNRRIARAAGRRGCEIAMVSWREFDYGMLAELEPDEDVVFFRTGAPAAVHVARAFEHAGFRVLNDSRYIQLSGQKYLANVHAAANDIPTPSLNVAVDKQNLDLLSVYLRQEGSLVVKPLVSRDMGRYVFLIRCETDLANVGRIPGSQVLVQSEVPFERLVRVVVTKERMLVEATTYDTKHENWKATVCENPLIKHYRAAPRELVRLSEYTLRVFGGDIAYIDFFETTSGFVLSEINHSCGLIQHERVSGYPIASELGSFLAGCHGGARASEAGARLARRRESSRSGTAPETGGRRP